jgi:N-acetylglucosamine-6-phosphate deacetylase
VEIEFGETIVRVVPAALTPGNYIAPGFIDIQVNGFAGVDYNQPDAPHSEIARSIHALFATGVTRFYPTVITGAPHDMESALRNLSLAKDSLPEGGAIEGFHVEGPHIGIDDGPRGAHPKRWVRKPDFDEFRRWQDATRNRIRIVTLSPEWPEATPFPPARRFRRTWATARTR